MADEDDGSAVAASSSFFHAERLARGDDDDGVMKESIQKRSRGCLDRQEVTPLLERPMAGQTQAATFVGGSNEAEE